MEQYFITDKVIKIITENLNNKFIQALDISYTQHNYNTHNKQLIKFIKTEINVYFKAYDKDLFNFFNKKNKSYFKSLCRNLKYYIYTFLENNHNKDFLIDILKYSSLSAYSAFIF